MHILLSGTTLPLAELVVEFLPVLEAVGDDQAAILLAIARIAIYQPAQCTSAYI